MLSHTCDHGTRLKVGREVLYIHAHMPYCRHALRGKSHGIMDNLMSFTGFLVDVQLCVVDVGVEMICRIVDRLVLALWGRGAPSSLRLRGLSKEL